MTQSINNTRVSQFTSLPSPAEIFTQFPSNEKVNATVITARETIQNIIDGKDDRKLVVMGPCSIDDPKSALEYAAKLYDLQQKVQDKMFLVMRAYFEKPRTTVGWKGLVYDPHLDNSAEIEYGIKQARELLIQINEMGLPTATEVLGPMIIQYYSDLISWTAIGARTTESQIHRELASGLSMPVGFKNGTRGNVGVAVDAIVSARAKHHFVGLDESGRLAVVETTGNSYGHIIFRGGTDGPNYSAEHIAEAEAAMHAADLKPAFIVDCSHGNSNKDHTKQAQVWHDVWQQIRSGNNSIIGFMLESHLSAGKQNMSDDRKYGVSLTDACISWEETEKLVLGV